MWKAYSESMESQKTAGSDIYPATKRMNGWRNYNRHLAKDSLM